MTETHDVEIVELLTTSNQGLIAAIHAVLNGAEIPFFVRGAEASSLFSFQATIVVPATYAEQAKEMIEALADQHEQDSEEE